MDEARRKDRVVLAALALLSYGIALLQRPGTTVSDTRVELSADPGLFLERTIWIWNGATDLGHVQSGQFTGYLFPMGPYFALGDAAGIPMWLLQRFWLGTLLFLAGWGAVRLVRALLPGAGWEGQAAALLVFVLNPYVVQYTSRGTVTLLAYAALPWLMLAVHRGVREPRGWLWPALVGLVMASTGGGINAALIAFALLGPAALLAYEVTVIGIDRSHAWSFVWRAGVAAALASVWWAVPLAIQSGYGANFLLFTEHPRTIWATTSIPELLRLLGLWTLYTGVGAGQPVPFMGVAGTYLFNPLVIVATFLVPLFAVWSVRLARQWRYAPFFALLAVLALLVMFAGFPAGTRLNGALIGLYDRVGAVQFLRTTHKAAPILALCLACLAAGGVAALVGRARSATLTLGRRPVPTPALALLAAIPLVAALPLLAGRGVDREQAYGSVPSSWKRALADADRLQSPGTRTMVLPGELFGWYRWGGITSPIGPAISRRGVAVREIVPYADARSAQLQIAVDDLLQQGRLVPGQLPPLLRLMDVGQVLVPTDGVALRNGATAPTEIASQLPHQPGFSRPAQEYGSTRRFAPPYRRGGQEARLPELRRYPLPGAPTPGGVRLKPFAGETILEGDAEGIVQLASVGLLEEDRALFYAGDLDPAGLERRIKSGARLVFTDSRRRRLFVASRTRANRGPTLGPHDPVPPDYARFDTLDRASLARQTVALHDGARRVFSPLSGVSPEFPEFRAYAAFDGRLDTTWLADENLPPRDWYVEIELKRPRSVQAIEIVPHRDRNSRTTLVLLSVNGGPERPVELHAGSNEVTLGAAALRTLRIRTRKIEGPPSRRLGGGLDEVRIPGVSVRERLRLPTALATRTASTDLSGNELVVLLDRATADFPTRAGADRLLPVARSPVAMTDAEPGLERELTLPAARSFALSGWATVAPDAPDHEIDRLAGLAAGWRFDSSSRFEGVPAHRASSAFDGSPDTIWAADAGATRPFLEWQTPRATSFRRVELEPGPPEYAFPARVRVGTPADPGVEAAVGSDGVVRLPRTLRGSRFRLTVLATRTASGPAARRGLRAVAIAAARLPGLTPPQIGRAGSFHTRCGELRAAGVSQTEAPATAPMQVTGTIDDLDAGRPLRLSGCGAPLRLRRGRSRLSVEPGATMRADHLALISAAPSPRPAPAPPGKVDLLSEGPPGVPSAARVDPGGPAWLVLAQSYSRGWRAWCRSSDGGEQALGEPLPIDGYANGWLVDAGCARVRFGFAPQRTANLAFALSGGGCLLLLAVALVAAARRRRVPCAALPSATAAPSAPPDRPLRASWVRAAAISVAVGLLAAGVFALRMGPVVAAVALVLLRTGTSVRRLIAVALLGLGLVPLLYLALLPRDRGGFNFDYARELLFAHWVAVVSVCCLAAAGALGAWRLRSLRPR